jgi:hypothetical protein
MLLRECLWFGPRCGQQTFGDLSDVPWLLVTVYISYQYEYRGTSTNTSNYECTVSYVVLVLDPIIVRINDII